MSDRYSETVQAGRYDKRVMFQKLAEVGRDSTGGVIQDWVDDFSLWAAFEPIKSDLLHAEVGDKRFAVEYALFRVRYQPSASRFIDPTVHRLVYVANPRISPTALTIWQIYPPEQKDSRFREWHVKARRYQ